jgi:prepilin-type N-terminal cleavage/methylation domain-containing protein
MRPRAGFTIIELVVVVMIASIVVGMSIPRLTRGLAQNRMQKAAAVVAADMQLAHSLAARQRSPVRISVDAANKVIRVRDHVTTTTIYNQRHLGSSEFGVQSIETDPVNEIIVYPTGLSNSRIQVTLRAAGSSRIVSMSRAGQVRVK